MSIPIKEKEVVVLSNQDFQSAEMGIAEEDVPTIISILRDKLYQNKERAIIREYGTNARDAMVECGNGDKPFEVWLPTRLEPILRIRDYGTGLTQDAVNQIFRFLGKSTKRDSNLFNGQLGIGAKSGLALANQFNVTSYIDGTAYFYVVLNDPTRKGRIDLIGTSVTDEPNGVEIGVPIPAASVEKIHQEAAHVYSFFDVVPLIHGLDTGKYPINRPKPILAGSNWRITGEASVAIMGNVAYPINDDFIVPEIHGAHGEKWKQFLASGVEIDFPIGSIDFAPSRESLSYNEHSVKVLTSTIDAAIKEAAKIVSDRLNTAPTKWDAMCLVHKLTSELGAFGKNLNTLLGGKIQWQGQVVTDRIIIGHNRNSQNSGWLVRIYSRNQYTDRFSTTGQPSEIIASDKHVIIENDGKTAQPAKMKHYCELNGYDNAYLIEFTSKTARDLFFKQHLEGIPVVPQSSLPKAPVGSGGNYTSGPSNPKHSLPCFVFAYNSSTTNSDSWEPETVDAKNGKGFYVVLDRFEVQREHGYGIHPHGYLELLKSAQSLLGFDWKKKTIVGIKKGWFDNHSLGSGWVNLLEHLRDEAKKSLEKQKLWQQAIDYSEYKENHVQNFTCFLPTVPQLQYPKLPFGEYMTQGNAAINHDKPTMEKLEIARKFFDEIGFDLHLAYTPTYQFGKGAEQIIETYPLVGVVGTGYYGNSYANNVEKFIHYINLCDTETIEGLGS